MCSSDLLGVARTLLANTTAYVQYLETREPGSYDVLAHESGAWELLKHFHELAAPQLAEWVLDERLFPRGEQTEPVDVLMAMDNELASWQRGSIVSSQQEPLLEFTFWLLDAQRVIAGQLEDDALCNTVMRGIEMAEKRLT